MREGNLAVYLLGPERLEFRTEPVPRPGPGELLVRVEAATTCGTDVKVYRRGGHPRMLRVPCRFGHEFAGTIAAVGARVTAFREGDRVVVANSASCGQCDRCRAGRENLCRALEYLNGAFAEYVLVPARFVERSTYRIGRGVAAEEAALAEPLACVLHGLDVAGGGEGGDAVVYGAGPIGLLFTAVLALEGREVTVADPNPQRLAAARALGAKETVTIARGGGAAEAVVARSRGGEGFELAVDATGIPEVWEDAIRSVRPGGTVNLFGGCAPGTRITLDTHHLHYGEVRIAGAYHHRPSTFEKALDLIAGGRLRVDLLISERRPLEETEKALRSMMAKRALKVALIPRDSSA